MPCIFSFIMYVNIIFLHKDKVGIISQCFRNNKRPMWHMAHLRNQFKAINTFEQSYDCIITLNTRGKKRYLPQERMIFICKTVSLLHLRMLCAILVGIGSDSGEEDFLNLVNVLFLFHYIILLKKGVVLRLNKNESQRCFVPS